MKRREFLKYGAAGLATVVTLPVVALARDKSATVAPASYGKFVPHEKMDLVILTGGYNELPRFIKTYPDSEDKIRFQYASPSSFTTHTVERIFMDSPTSAKPGQYRYIIETPCGHDFPGISQSVQHVRGTMIDCFPGEDYREVRRKLLGVIGEHRRYESCDYVAYMTRKAV